MTSNNSHVPTHLHDLAKRAEVHIFDVDHTLTHHSTGRRFIQVGHQLGYFPIRYLAYLPLFYLRYRIGKLSLRDLSREIKPLTGLRIDELESIAMEAWNRFVRHDLYSQATDYVGLCKDAGAPVILASTSFDIILRPLASHLSADETIASILETQDGVATGWIRSGPCYAELKAQRIADTLDRIGIDPQTCAFYTDSFHDLPSLEMVGYPVAVYPDFALRRIARLRGWPIVRWL